MNCNSNLIKRISVIAIVSILTFITFFSSTSNNKINAKDSGVSDSILLPTRFQDISYSSIRKHALYAVDGGYVRVINNNDIWIETYDENFSLKSKKMIKMELPVWGGSYLGKDSFFLIEGQNNEEEDDEKEVIRIIRYDKAWNRIGAAKVKSGNDSFAKKVSHPFDAGCVEMSERNGMLYIVTGHEGYVDEEIGSPHQGYLMITVDESNMEGEITGWDLHHSFAQYIDSDENEIYVAELSEGDECACLSRVSPDGKRQDRISMLSYGGQRTSSRAVQTYSTVNGLELSNKNILTIGTSIDQSQYNAKKNGEPISYNLYLTVTPRDSFTSEDSQFKWITDYNDCIKGFMNAEITDVGNNHFLITWEKENPYYQNVWSWETIADYYLPDQSDLFSWHELHYMIIDGDGNIISNEQTVNAAISSCKPILKDNEAIFCMSCENELNFYMINTLDSTFRKKCIRMAGDQATWDMDNGILTISGAGTVSFRMGYSYNAIKKKITNLIIKDGIDSISDLSFNGFVNLSHVEFSDTIKEINHNAFGACPLYEITIPDSVTYIASDAFGSNYGKIIQCNTGVYAETYAEQQGISYQYLDDDNLLKYGALSYIKRNNQIIIRGCDANVQGCVIPEEIEGLPVKRIAMKAFANCTQLKSVQIPDSVIRIDNTAFYDCRSLSSVVLPKNLLWIGDHAFSECKSLSSVDIPSNITSIARAAFNNCTNLSSIKITNPECNIFDAETTISNGFELINGEYSIYYNGSICGYDNSTAQSYAQKYGYKFESLGEAPKVIQGDVNNDGVFNISDIVLLQKWLLAVPDTHLANWKAADLCEDDRLDVFDLCMMKRKLVENS